MPKLKLKRTPAEEESRARKKARKSRRKHGISERFDDYGHQEPRFYDDDDTLPDERDPGPSRPRPHAARHVTPEGKYDMQADDDFDAKMRDALEDDAMFNPSQRLDGVEAQLNSYAHIPKRWRGTDEGFAAGLWMEDALNDIGLETWQMNDDEYAEYIRAGMWRFALSEEPVLRKEIKRVLDIIGSFQNDEDGIWRCFRACLDKADEHDLGRLIFVSMNTIARTAVLSISDGKMRDVMSVIQTLVDNKVTNHGALRGILFELVARKDFLPSSLRITDKVYWEASHQDEPWKGGGMADIYLGRFRGRRVALKRTRTLKSKESSMKALRQEAIIWRQLRHKHVMPLIGICDSLISGCDLLVSRWMENGDLLTYMKQVEENGGTIDGKNLMEQVASGLQYLHEQDPPIIHCDLRASNVVVDEDQRLLLIDFGIAQVERIQTIVMSQGDSQGTFRWMAPEILKPPDDHRGTTLSTKTDVYAYAMTCLEIFTSSIPFSSHKHDVQVLLEVIDKGRPSRPTGLADKRGLTDSLWSLIELCWDHEPARRPSMSEILVHLERVVSGPLTESPMLMDTSPSSFDVPLDERAFERNGNALSLTHAPTPQEPPYVPPSPRWIQGVLHNIAQRFPFSYGMRLPSISGVSDSTTVPRMPSSSEISAISDMDDRLLNSPGIKRRRSLSPPTPRKALTYSEVVRNRGQDHSVRANGISGTQHI